MCYLKKIVQNIFYFLFRSNIGEGQDLLQLIKTALTIIGIFLD